MANERILAPVTGVVWQLGAKVGETLDAGAPLLLLESMKMEIPVPLPRAGRVVSIAVKEGDTVAEGQLLGEIE